MKSRIDVTKSRDKIADVTSVSGADRRNFTQYCIRSFRYTTHDLCFGCIAAKMLLTVFTVFHYRLLNKVFSSS